MSFVAEEISDGKVLNLIESWLKAGVMNEGKIEETMEGTPQGGVASPLLANIYLHEMDKQVANIDSIRRVRYADDCVIHCKTKEEAERTEEEKARKRGAELMRWVIEIERLRLEIEREKAEEEAEKENEWKPRKDLVEVTFFVPTRVIISPTLIPTSKALLF